LLEIINFWVIGLESSLISTHCAYSAKHAEWNEINFSRIAALGTLLDHFSAPNAPFPDSQTPAMQLAFCFWTEKPTELSWACGSCAFASTALHCPAPVLVSAPFSHRANLPRIKASSRPSCVLFCHTLSEGWWVL